MTGFTLILVVVALAMTLIAARVMLNERRRSAARVAALTADIRGSGPDVSIRGGDPEAQLHDRAVRHEESVPVMPSDMFAPAERSPHQFKLMPAVLVLAVVAAIGLAFVSARYRTTERPSAQAAQAPVPPAAPQALELLMLDHDRTGDHLIVRGIIRNPPRGSEVDHLTAVVLLFDQQGSFLTSGRTPVATPTLEPGAEGSFVISVPGAADVSRFRVSFRTDDRVVPHIDRRHG
jgi:hypothetical protein